MTAGDLLERQFQHEAMLYQGIDGFLAGTIPFLRNGIAAQEPILVLVDAPKTQALQGELGRDADRVKFADIAEVGRNPARILPVWRRFVDDHLTPERAVRGVGEPIGAGRSPAELVECQAHETLLNVAFANGQGWSLLCPYDVSALDEDVVEEARRSHPMLVTGGERMRSNSFVETHPSPARLDAPLPPPPAEFEEFDFGPAPSSLRLVRSRVARFAHRAGLGVTAVEHVVMAASELATNSIRYGGGRGTMRLWLTPDSVLCEFADRGRITGPALLGREMPNVRQESGRGLWLVNQLCDLVQIRSGAMGTVIRLHMSRPA